MTDKELIVDMLRRSTHDFTIIGNAITLEKTDVAFQFNEDGSFAWIENERFIDHPNNVF